MTDVLHTRPVLPQYNCVRHGDYIKLGRYRRSNLPHSFCVHTLFYLHNMLTMHLLPAAILALLPSITSTSHSPRPPPPPPPEYLFTNPPPTSPHAYKIPNLHDSAILARRILNLSSIATLSTVFPPSSQTTQQQHLLSQQEPHPPSHYTPDHLSVSGAPIGLMDYYASCPPHPSHPTILALSIATTFRNVHAGSNISLSLRWTPPADAPPRDDDPWAYVPANMPRFSLEGYIERIPEEEVEEYAVEECFFGRHREARTWRPGNRIHESWWGRLRVRGVYWVGGFGDRSFIGWIPGGEWDGVTGEEVRRARLVGEEGYLVRRWEDGDGEL